VFFRENPDVCQVFCLAGIKYKAKADTGVMAEGAATAGRRQATGFMNPAAMYPE
jgi:hypothetical protein